MQAAELARTVTVFRVDGRNADIFRNSTSRRTAPRTNVRIGANDTLITGDNTQVYLNLDTLSLLKMDSNSEVHFELTNNLIGLNLQHGTALVQVAEQQPNNSIEGRVGNIAMGVRGTMFTMGHFAEENIVFIAMLSGNGEVDGIILEAGQILTSWYDEDEPQVHITGQIIHDWRNLDLDRNIAISEIYLPELDTFTLQEILNNSEYLLENSNFVTQDLLNQIPPLLETETVAETPQRSFRDAQSRWQIAQQNRRAEESANNQNNQVGENYDLGNFVVPSLPNLPPVVQLPPSGGNGGSGGNQTLPDTGNGGSGGNQTLPDTGNGGNGGNQTTPTFIVIAGQTISTNATSVSLSNMSLTDIDIEPLANLTNLTWLNLSFNNLINLEPLANLTNLTTLILHGNNITNLEPLAKLTNLTTLSFSNISLGNNNNLTNLEPLANLTNLTSLTLGWNNITNLEPLAKLTNLTSLGLQNNNITNRTPYKPY